MEELESEMFKTVKATIIETKRVKGEKTKRLQQINVSLVIKNINGVI